MTQYLALRAIDEEGLTGVELARRASVSAAAVSQLLAALESAGLVERQPAAGDRRRQPLRLGTRGRETLDSAEGLLQEELAALLGDLPHPEVDALGRLLTRLERTLTGAAPPPRPRPPRPHHPK